MINKIIFLFSSVFFTTNGGRTTTPIINNKSTLQILEITQLLSKLSVSLKGSQFSLSTKNPLYIGINILIENTYKDNDNEITTKIKFNPAGIIPQQEIFLIPHKELFFKHKFQNQKLIYDFYQETYDSKDSKQIMEKYNEEIFNRGTFAYLLNIFSGTTCKVTKIGTKIQKIGSLELGSFVGGVFSPTGEFSAFPISLSNDTFNKSKASLFNVGQYTKDYLFGIRLLTTLYKLQINSYELLESTKVIPYMIFKTKQNINIGIIGVFHVDYGDNKFEYMYKNLENKVKFLDRINYNIPLFINFKKFRDLQIEMALIGKDLSLKKLTGVIKLNIYEKNTTKLNFTSFGNYTISSDSHYKDGKNYSIKISMDLSWKSGNYTYQLKLGLPELMNFFKKKTFLQDLNPFNPNCDDKEGKYFLPIISFTAKYDGEAETKNIPMNMNPLLTV